MRYFLLLFFVSCSYSGTYEEVTDVYTMPPELEGCKVFVLSSGGRCCQKVLHVLKCPKEHPIIASPLSKEQ